MGIRHYIGSHTGFSAVLKQRFCDFHVHEIDLNGREALLTSTDLPPQELPPGNPPDLAALVGAGMAAQLQALAANPSTSASVEILGLEDKAVRSQVSQAGGGQRTG